MLCLLTAAARLREVAQMLSHLGAGAFGERRVKGQPGSQLAEVAVNQP
jgi:hypothetical protein